MNGTSQRFPAILIGGPPHAGKSVLARNLTGVLKQARIQHYLLRAAPDGEGNWYLDAPRDIAEGERRKGTYTSMWIEHMCRDIANRPLPFLVDVGGNPRAWDEAIFEQCTHAVLLVKDAASEKRWQTLMDTYNVPVIAVLTSKLKGEQVLDARRPVLRGIITALKRGQRETGAVFEALVARVKALLNYNYDELWRVHRQQAPIDPVFDIPKLYRKINPARSGFTWEPLDLPAVLKYLPRKTSLGLYGIGPVWLYAAAACHTFPVQFFQFDARRGWVNPIVCKANAPRPPVKVTVRETSQYIHLKTDLPEDYLVYHPEMSLPLPPSPTAKGVVLDGKGPAWFYTGLALHFRRSPWVAVFYPQLDRAVVVFSKVKMGQYAISETVTLRK